MAFPTPEPEAGNTWQETRTFWADDQFLRRHRFQIASRPQRGEAVWERDGERYGHAEALRLATAERELAMKQGAKR